MPTPSNIVSTFSVRIRTIIIVSCICNFCNNIASWLAKLQVQVNLPQSVSSRHFFPFCQKAACTLLRPAACTITQLLYIVGCHQRKSMKLHCTLAEVAHRCSQWAPDLVPAITNWFSERVVLPSL